jgi:hypothetical protein
MDPERLKGSCLCGAVTYELWAPFLRFAHCHCSRCRKATGSAHATNLYTSPERFRWTSGTEQMVRYDLPTAKGFATTFCRQCGSPLPHLTRSGREVVVPAGSLDSEPSIRPTARIFFESAAGWGCAGGDLPHFSEYPDWWRA